MEWIQVSSNQENIPGRLLDRALSENHHAGKERLAHAERTVRVSQAASSNNICPIHNLIQDSFTTLVIAGGQNLIQSTENEPEAMLQGLVNKGIDDKLKYLKLESHLIRWNEKVRPSPQQVEGITKELLNN